MVTSFPHQSGTCKGSSAQASSTSASTRGAFSPSKQSTTQSPLLRLSSYRVLVRVFGANQDTCELAKDLLLERTIESGRLRAMRNTISGLAAYARAACVRSWDATRRSTQFRQLRALFGRVRCADEREPFLRNTIGLPRVTAAARPVTGEEVDLT